MSILKTTIKALLISLIVHVIYFVSLMVVGYIKTINFVPSITEEYDHVAIWQQKTSFGMMISPNIYLLTFIILTIIIALLINAYKVKAVLKK